MIPDAVLVENAVRAARPRSHFPCVRWVAVRDTLGVGSTSARDLCARFRLDPDEMLDGTDCDLVDE